MATTVARARPIWFARSSWRSLRRTRAIRIRAPSRIRAWAAGESSGGVDGAMFNIIDFISHKVNYSVHKEQTKPRWLTGFLVNAAALVSGITTCVLSGSNYAHYWFSASGAALGPRRQCFRPTSTVVPASAAQRTTTGQLTTPHFPRRSSPGSAVRRPEVPKQPPHRRAPLDQLRPQSRATEFQSCS